jgi:hypothetical protein
MQAVLLVRVDGTAGVEHPRLLESRDIRTGRRSVAGVPLLPRRLPFGRPFWPGVAFGLRFAEDGNWTLEVLENASQAQRDHLGALLDPAYPDEEAIP